MICSSFSSVLDFFDRARLYGTAAEPITVGINLGTGPSLFAREVYVHVIQTALLIPTDRVVIARFEMKTRARFCPQCCGHGTG